MNKTILASRTTGAWRLTTSATAGDNGWFQVWLDHDGADTSNSNVICLGQGRTYAVALEEAVRTLEDVLEALQSPPETWVIVGGS